VAQIVIHRKGAFNIYGTIADDCYFPEALTREQIEEHAPVEKIERAIKHGSSYNEPTPVEKTVCVNALGLSVKAFIQKYLTLPNEKR